MTLDMHNRIIETLSASVKNCEYTLLTARQMLHDAILLRHAMFGAGEARAAQIDTLRAERDDARREAAELKQQLSGVPCA